VCSGQHLGWRMVVGTPPTRISSQGGVMVGVDALRHSGCKWEGDTSNITARKLLNAAVDFGVLSRIEKTVDRCISA
jgi:hypothetical protein